MARNLPPRTERGRRLRLAALIGGWLGIVAAGAAVLLVYQNTAGAPGDPPGTWPRNAPLSLAPDRPTLVLFAHPRCPCTRATLEELARLAARRPGGFATRVLFLRPSGYEPGWERTDLWRSAAAIPGAEVLADAGGRTARLFGSETSGHALLYDRDGRLRFQGGLTASRGHAGDSAARSLLLTLLDGRAVDRARTPVFGCSLACPASRPGSGTDLAARTEVLR